MDLAQTGYLPGVEQHRENNRSMVGTGGSHWEGALTGGGAPVSPSPEFVAARCGWVDARHRLGLCSGVNLFSFRNESLPQPIAGGCER